MLKTTLKELPGLAEFEKKMTKDDQGKDIVDPECAYSQVSKLYDEHQTVIGQYSSYILGALDIDQYIQNIRQSHSAILNKLMIMVGENTTTFVTKKHFAKDLKKIETAIEKLEEIENSIDGYKKKILSSINRANSTEGVHQQIQKFQGEEKQKSSMSKLTYVKEYHKEIS